MIAVGQDAQKHLMCPFSGRQIDIFPCGPNFYAESKHGWRGPMKKTVKAVENWLKKLDWSKEKPRIVKAGERWMVVSPSGWFSHHDFQDVDQAQRWLNWKDGENLNPKIEVKHGKLDVGAVTDKVGTMPETSMNITPVIAHLFRNGVPEMPEERVWE